MRAVDIIYKKRDNLTLTEEELDFFIKGYVNGEIPDYQMSSLLMAVFFRGFNPQETVFLTKSMINSGETIDLSSIPKIKVDKHSTGGVGDKTSLLIAPLAASCGVAVPMMCGRGLGQTGGTLDKMEAIKGYNVFLSKKDIEAIITQCGFVICGQTQNIVPADKKMYALRDVTATVESIPLITASILSKKIAEGTDYLVMDIKCGSGAFMKNFTDAKKLAESIVNTGNKLGKKVIALITDMSTPLGFAIGNYLEVKECVNILQYCNLNNDYQIPENFRLSSDLIYLSIEIVANMLIMAKIASNFDEAKKIIANKLNTREAYNLFLKNIELQGGDTNYITNDILKANYIEDIRATEDGYIENIDAYKFGLASMYVGAGRKIITDSIDYSCGIELTKKIGDKIVKDEIVAKIYYNNKENLQNSKNLCYDGIEISNEKIHSKNIVLDMVESC
ncbi:MAG: thymidine phosphorylase [Spirochaetes bacterium GWC1_27_15]|nr:MAG: thymidine phosphorylase [Spirochaetes bacterium GWB1_27_13]OHD20659.1 MAG: thymidine phosphorylase [Spirochaetes bacterium GWC1_27_15]